MNRRGFLQAIFAAIVAPAELSRLAKQTQPPSDASDARIQHYYRNGAGVWIASDWNYHNYDDGVGTLAAIRTNNDE